MSSDGSGLGSVLTCCRTAAGLDKLARSVGRSLTRSLTRSFDRSLGGCGARGISRTLWGAFRTFRDFGATASQASNHDVYMNLMTQARDVNFHDCTKVDTI